MRIVCRGCGKTHDIKANHVCECGWRFVIGVSGPANRTPSTPKPRPTSTPKGRYVGVGYELKKLLRLLGYTDVPGCQCSKHAAAMDGKGIEWCKENVDTIVGWLREEAERREKRFSEKGAKALVWVAIRKAQLRRFLNERVSKSV